MSENDALHINRLFIVDYAFEEFYGYDTLSERLIIHHNEKGECRDFETDNVYFNFYGLDTSLSV